MTSPGRLSFVVEGEPVGKGRARSTRSGHHYTPAKTRAAEQRIAIAAREALLAIAAREALWFYQSFKLEPGAPLAMDVAFLLKKPKTGKNAKAAHGSPCTKKPDLDNLVKLVKDALNGVAYEDDSCITAIHATKAWADVPSTIVNVWRIE